MNCVPLCFSLSTSLVFKIRPSGPKWVPISINEKGGGLSPPPFSFSETDHLFIPPYPVVPHHRVGTGRRRIERRGRELICRGIHARPPCIDISRLTSIHLEGRLYPCTGNRALGPRHWDNSQEGWHPHIIDQRSPKGDIAHGAVEAHQQVCTLEGVEPAGDRSRRGALSAQGQAGRKAHPAGILIASVDAIEPVRIVAVGWDGNTAVAPVAGVIYILGPVYTIRAVTATQRTIAPIFFPGRGIVPIKNARVTQAPQSRG